MDLYSQWCETLKIEMKSKSKINVQQRMEKMEKIVNSVIQSNSVFSITAEHRRTITANIENKIDSWRGVEIEVCKGKVKKTFASYSSTARNWFNRNKAKIYGNYLFYEIIFHSILDYSLTHAQPSPLVLFIDIFECILSEYCQFPRTKLQPLVPFQSLMQPNLFKQACLQFTKYYNVAFDCNHSTVRDRDRAKKVHEQFMNCLNGIKNQKDNTSIRCLTKSFLTDPRSEEKEKEKGKKELFVDETDYYNQNMCGYYNQSNINLFEFENEFENDIFAIDYAPIHGPSFTYNNNHNIRYSPYNCNYLF